MANRGFARLSPWLRQLFTPSEGVPPDPVKLSTDVSLVANYDGGGYPIPNPESWFIGPISTPASVNTSVNIATVGPDEIVRILAVSVLLGAGAAPTAHLNIIAGGALLGMPISATLTPDTDQRAMDIFCPIAGPNMILRGLHFGGDVLTITEWRVLIVRAPLGTVFHV